MDQEAEKKIKSRKPGYDGPAGSNGKNTLSDSDDLKTQYQHFLRRRIPSMIREELETEVAKSFNDVGSVMQSRLSTWIRNSAARCAKIFEYIPSPTEAAAQGDPEAVVPKSRESSPISGTAGAAGSYKGGEGTIDAWPFSLPEDLSLEFQISEEDLSAFDQFLQTGFDSAYGSGSMGGSS
ncbi:uncharacterized protein ColSpa_07314 [Colletotrichum spaethianum]|uniref:Uncharacterized protein n=1 Tax=Colletotrichum spaethianum TaxID=700344 RepID=A0AA37LIG3_9PEZI|nr:uncharacterized protein ColSpa_07314 [Colletotrichum spaethianum]GKT47133.1 hypothetical protein ColSpa_07314 [Colletotrichum spaethianum]